MIRFFVYPEQVLHVHSAGVPEDPHSCGEVDRAGAGLRVPTAAHTIWHEVSSYGTAHIPASEAGFFFIMSEK
jgi:hypothetical protein